MEIKLKAPRLNNMTLGFNRRSIEYEAVMTDLALMGAIPKEVCEQFTGVKFADYLKPPEGYAIPEAEELVEEPVKKAKKKVDNGQSS